MLVSKDLKNEIHTSEYPSYNSFRAVKASSLPFAAVLRGISARGREWFLDTEGSTSHRSRIRADSRLRVRIIIAIKSGNLERFLGASDFLESPVSQKYGFVDRKAVFRLSSFFVSVPLHSLATPVSLSLSLPISIPSHRRGTAQPRHAHTRTSVCMFCGWLCSDSRRSTRGYYIVKPFNYLGKLLPGIYIRPSLP